MSMNFTDTSLNAALVFNKLYDVLQTEQKNLLKDIEVDVHKAIQHTSH